MGIRPKLEGTGLPGLASFGGAFWELDANLRILDRRLAFTLVLRERISGLPAAAYLNQPDSKEAGDGCTRMVCRIPTL